jgi:pimeloyl-ACP methyl ester carboxylesterase
MQTAHGIGVELTYTERGEGAVVLLIHGLAADALTFEPVLEALAPYARAIAYDRRGYGASGAPEPYERTTVEEQGEDAVALLHELGVERALICGDGFGALVALDLLKRYPALVSGAVLRDPPLFAFVPAATEALGKQREALGRALAEGGPAAAVDAWLGRRVEGPALERARSAHRAFFADYAGLATLSLTRAQLRAIHVPVAVVTGPFSPPTIVAAADNVAQLIPHARRTTDGDFITAALELVERAQ